jgi:prefoldin alpha subunit
LSKAFEQELEQLNASYVQLQTAVKKFTESKSTVQYLKEKSKGKEIMVPLTSSLYVPGVMEENDKVLVEVGAGYFIEESTDKAKEYCDRKIKMLSESATKVGEII